MEYLVRLRIFESLLLHTQLTHFGHEFVRVDEEARTEQEGEDVRPLHRRKQHERRLSSNPSKIKGHRGNGTWGNKARQKVGGREVFRPWWVRSAWEKVQKKNMKVTWAPNASRHSRAPHTEQKGNVSTFCAKKRSRSGFKNKDAQNTHSRLDNSPPLEPGVGWGPPGSRTPGCCPESKGHGRPPRGSGTSCCCSHRSSAAPWTVVSAACRPAKEKTNKRLLRQKYHWRRWCTRKK